MRKTERALLIRRGTGFLEIVAKNLEESLHLTQMPADAIADFRKGIALRFQLDRGPFGNGFSPQEDIVCLSGLSDLAGGGVGGGQALAHLGSAGALGFERTLTSDVALLGEGLAMFVDDLLFGHLRKDSKSRRLALAARLFITSLAKSVES